MDKDKFLQTGLLEQYVLGLTDEEETAVVEQYADNYPEIKAEIDQMRNALDEYAKQYAVMPPKELKVRVMDGVGGADRGLASAVPGTAASGTSWWGALLFTLLVGIVVFLYRGKAAAEQEMAMLESRYITFKKECEDEKEALLQQQQLFATLNHEATLPVRLEGAAPGSGAQAIAYLNVLEKAAYINTGNLPKLPSGKTYQLWADVEGEMINMGVLNMESDGLQAVIFIDHAESLNITIEPAGGSKEPTVERLVANGEV